MRDAAQAVPLVGAGDNEVRLLLARHLDQSQVGPTDARFHADAGDALPQQSVALSDNSRSRIRCTCGGL